jgi:hypothetical protein
MNSVSPSNHAFSQFTFNTRPELNLGFETVTAASQALIMLSLIILSYPLDQLITFKGQTPGYMERGDQDPLMDAKICVKLIAVMFSSFLPKSKVGVD